MQFILSDEKLNTWIQINTCVYEKSVRQIFLRSSGGHFNPAVSLTMVTLGKLSVPHFLIYCVVQTFGAFLGAAAALGIYYDQFVHFTEGVLKIVGPKSTARCFCSFPDPHISNTTCFFDQVVGTGLLVFFVCVIIDKRNRIPDAAHPLLFGLTLLLIGKYHDYYFWIPIVAPCVGGVLAAWMYYTCIGAHIPDPNDDYPMRRKRDLGHEAGESSRRSSRSRHRVSPK
uniref:Aquaporin n=1 Tax=Angiostrongylus cantonensis TaxID=6313 RepID=A0A0K0DLE1_ANGCA